MTSPPMLDYQAAKPEYVETPQESRWRGRRLAYYVAHLLLFFLIVYRVGPNLFLFHSPFSPTPADYAALTPTYEPTIAAIKAYQRDHGKLPMYSHDLPPQYKPTAGDAPFGTILGTGSITFQIGSSTVLEYDFRTATEGWTVYAPRYYGRVPAPVVPAAPTPATLPATTRSADDTR